MCVKYIVDSESTSRILVEPINLACATKYNRCSIKVMYVQ